MILYLLLGALLVAVLVLTAAVVEAAIVVSRHAKGLALRLATLEVTVAQGMTEMAKAASEARHENSRSNIVLGVISERLKDVTNRVSALEADAAEADTPQPATVPVGHRR